jgi:hypothetical protein
LKVPTAGKLTTDATPAVVTSRIRLLPVSAMKMFPKLSRATQNGAAGGKPPVASVVTTPLNAVGAGIPHANPDASRTTEAGRQVKQQPLTALLAA